MLEAESQTEDKEHQVPAQNMSDTRRKTNHGIYETNNVIDMDNMEQENLSVTVENGVTNVEAKENDIDPNATIVNGVTDIL